MQDRIPIKQKSGLTREKKETGYAHERSKKKRKQDDAGDNDVVATNTALQLAAQWLGVSADDVIGELNDADGGDDPRGAAPGASRAGVQAYPGLGFGTKRASFVSKSKSNSAWNRKVDERLLNQRRRRPADEYRERANRGEVSGSDTEEDESRAMALGKRNNGGMSKIELLQKGGSDNRKKRRKKK